MGLRLGRRLFAREWKRLAVIAGIVALSLSFFVVITMIVANVNQQVSDEIKPLVGADVIIESSQPLDEAAMAGVERVVEDYDVRVSHKVSFSTNLVLPDAPAQLVEVWGVDELYPLYGELVLEDWVGVDETGVYVDEETAEEFVRDGRLRLGAEEFVVAGTIVALPAASANFFDDGRTVIMPREEVARTQLTQLGSRVSYETLLQTVASDEVLAALRGDERLGAYEIDDGQERVMQLQEVTDEFGGFVTMIVIVTFVLVATTIFVAVRTFFVNQQQVIGLLKLLGQRNRETVWWYGGVLLTLFVLGWLVAGGVSVLVLGGLQQLPLTSEFVLYPVAWGQGGVVALVLAGVSLALPLLEVWRCEPLALLRPGGGALRVEAGWLQVVISVVGCRLLYVVTVGGVWRAVIFVVVLFVLIGVLAAVIWGVLRVVMKLVRPWRQRVFLVYDGVRSLLAPGNQSLLMTVGVVATMSVLLVVSGVARGFLEQLEVVRGEQPSLYVLNVLPEDVGVISERYPGAVLYDVILSRIESVNGVALVDHLARGEGGRPGEFTREFNVTSVDLPLEEYLLGGPPVTGEVSLDEEFAERLGVGMDDRVGFFVQGRRFELVVSSLRVAQRDGSGPFFFVQFARDEFAQAPKTYFWPVDDAGVDKELIRDELLGVVGTHLSFVDVDEVIETVRDVTRKLTNVVQLLAGCILFFVLCTIAVCLDAMKSLKQRKVRLYGLLGATETMIRRSLWTEIVVLFGVALVLAMVVAGVVASGVFGMSDLLGWSWGVVTAMLGLVGIVFVVIVGMVGVMGRL